MMVEVEQIEIQKGDLPSEEFFSELSNIKTKISDLHLDHGVRFEKAHEKFCLLVGKYQEQPHLLDPYLEELVTELLAIVRKESVNDCPTTLFNGALKYLYQLAKVRMYKNLVKFFPHEIKDLDFVLSTLEAQDIEKSDLWETRYILLLWLSILVMNPFEMSRLDAFVSPDENDDEGICDDNHMNELTKSERIYNICKLHTQNNDTCASVAAFLSAKFLIRIDIKDTYLPKFLNWIVNPNENQLQNDGIKFGQLSAISAILKHGKREDLLVHGNKLLKWTLTCNYKDSSDYLKYKFFIKIIQRLGLVFLKPRLAQWRYQRGSRSLTQNLSTSAAEKMETENNRIEIEEKDEDIVVPDEIEEIIEELLQGLRSPSSDARWSAAKGIGRVTNRLPKALGDEVIGSVIELINPLEPHEAWHGGCLAIAELSKRGLLLPYRLECMVPLLLQALCYDEMKGYMSVGQHIRDAACYMSWSFARAYEPSDLQPFVQKIAAGLLITTVFDREVNCRRAASAAFQESVGRLGNFPYGIDIIVEADFYSVGLRNHSYLDISYFIAQYEEYTCPLIDHLVERKISHWDTAIRELTSKALFKLTKRNPQYMSDTVLPTLFTKTDSIDVNLRHGSVLAIGEIVLSLSEIELANPNDKYLNDNLVNLINDLVEKFHSRGQFRGMSGELMYQCCGDFIKNCSKANVKLTEKCIEIWQNTVDNCIIQKSAQLREVAVEALTELSKTYYSNEMVIENNNAIVQKYLKGCQDDLKENTRMGYVLGLGSLTKYMIKPNLQSIVMMLIKQALIPSMQYTVLAEEDVKSLNFELGDSHMTNNWSEARRDSIKALVNVIQSIGFDVDGTDSETISNDKYLDKIFKCFLVALQEYTIDDRGDIGAWVREAAMNGLYTLITSCPNNLLKPDIIHSVMLGFVQQSVEIIDRTRALAGNLFCKLIHHTPSIPHIKRHELLKSIFPENSQNILWLYADHTFPLFCALLEFPEYTEPIILGLTQSIGKLSESLIKHSSDAMFTFLRNNPNEIPRICNEIIQIYNKNQQNDRIIQPMLNFLDMLLRSGSVNSVLLDEESNFCDEIYRLTKLETKGQKKLYKLISSINVFSQLIQVPKLCKKVLASMAVFLGFTHVLVRKATGKKLYEEILVHGLTVCEIDEDNFDEILEILVETDWGKPLTEVRPLRNHLFTLLGVQVPIAVAKK